MQKAKRILCKVLSAAIAVMMLGGCQNGDSSSGTSEAGGSSAESTGLTLEEAQGVKVDISLTVNGQDVDLTNPVEILYINGRPVYFDTYRYYWLYYYDILQSNNADMDDPDVLQILKEAVLSELENVYGVIMMGKDNGVSFDGTNEQALQTITEVVGGFDGADDFKDALESEHMTYDALMENYVVQAEYQAAGEALLAETGPLAKTKEDFLAAVENGDFCRTLNLLVPYSCGAELSEEDKEGWDELTVTQKSNKYDAAYDALDEEGKKAAREKAKQLADEVIAKVNAGEDFYQLMAEYNLDPGMAPKDAEDITSVDGYYITKDYSFVQEYIDGAFALEENQTSGLVETTYGYHIIKRLPLDMEYIENNTDDMASDYSSAYINKAIGDYMDNLKIEYCDFYDDIKIDSIK